MSGEAFVDSILMYSESLFALPMSSFSQLQAEKN